MYPRRSSLPPSSEVRDADPSSAAGTLDIETKDAGGVVQVRLQGALDMLTAPLLAAALARIRTPGRRDLVVDVSELSFMDREGLSALLEAVGQGAQRTVLSVTGCPPSVRRAVELTGNEDLIPDPPAAGQTRKVRSG